MYTSLVMLVVLSSFLGCGSTTQISITPDTVSVRSLDLPSIQCVPGSLSSKTVLHMQIIKIGETKPMATVFEHNHVTTTHAVKATGLIQNGGSFLNVTFEKIGPDMTGQYTCKVTYFVDVGTWNTSSDTASLTVVPAGVDTLLDNMKELVFQFKHREATSLDRINSLEQSLITKIACLEHNQQTIMTSLDKILATNITRCEQNQTKEITSLPVELCPDSSWTKVDKLCYKAFHTQKLNWPDALNYCRTRNGTLVQIHNQETNAMVAGLLAGHPGKSYWMGANDIKDEGQFEWVASSTRQTAVPITKTSYQNWYPGDPNDDDGGGHGADCVGMMTYSVYSGKWWDADCKYKFPFVCQTNAIYLQQ